MTESTTPDVARMVGYPVTPEQLQIYELQDRLEEVETRLSNSIRQAYRGSALLPFLVYVAIERPPFVEWFGLLVLLGVFVEIGVRQLVPPRQPTVRYTRSSANDSPEQEPSK